MSSSSTLESTTRLPTAADVEEAALRLAGQAVPTPLLRFPALDARVGGRILVKPETFQRNGSFKFRGAYNKVAGLAAAGVRAVVAYSSGNHAQGVADAARLCGLAATIIMPSDAPAIKIANTRFYGAEVVLYDRHREDREMIARRIAAARGAVVIAPYEDARVIAGQGTVGLEIARQAKALGLTLDAVLAPVSGGGLIAGTAVALATACPGTQVYSVEPVGLDDLRRSLAAGERIANDPAARSICDALLAPIPGAIAFALNRRLLAGGLAVPAGELLDAIAEGFADYKLVIEPGGAAALAAILSGKLDIKGKTVAVIASGGNVDRGTFIKALGGG